MSSTKVRIRGEELTVGEREVKSAMREYNCHHRTSRTDAGSRHAVLDARGRSYPPKRLLSQVTRKPRAFFSGGDFTNRVFRDLRFRVVKSGSSVDLDAPVPEMEELVRTLFSRKWKVLIGPAQPKPNFATVEDNAYPGVYLLAYGQPNLSGKRVRARDIVYVGMTHAGLRVRLKAFVDGMEKNCCHSGAMKFFRTTEFGNSRPYS